MKQPRFIKHQELITSPQLQDEVTASRIDHDASLLDGGAQYDNRILRPTDEQVSQLKYEKPSTVEDYNMALNTLEARRLLRDGAVIKNGVLQVTADQYDIAKTLNDQVMHLGVARRLLLSEVPNHYMPDIDLGAVDKNRADLATDIAAVLEPYSLVFDHRLPPASRNKRTFFSNRVRTRFPGPIKWQDTVQQPSGAQSYEFSLSYELGEDVNIKTAVSMKADPMPEAPEGINMEVWYEHGKVSEVLTNTLHTLPSELKDIRGGVSIRFGLEGDTQCFSVHSLYGSENITYDFNPESNDFVLTNIRGWGRHQQNEPPKALTTAKFCAMLSDALGLLPTKEVSF